MRAKIRWLLTVVYQYFMAGLEYHSMHSPYADSSVHKEQLGYSDQTAHRSPYALAYSGSFVS